MYIMEIFETIEETISTNSVRHYVELMFYTPIDATVNVQFGPSILLIA